MPDALCAPHKRRGLMVTAHRIVNGVPKCDGCFRGKPIQGGMGPGEKPADVIEETEAGARREYLIKHVERLPDEVAEKPKASPQREQALSAGIRSGPAPKNGGAMPKKLEVDWDAVPRDRDAGIPVTQLVKKYGVQSPRIYTHTHGQAGKAKSAERAAAAGRVVIAPRNGNGRGRFAPAIDCLRAERDTLNELIQKLEAIN